MATPLGALSQKAQDGVDRLQGQEMQVVSIMGVGGGGALDHPSSLRRVSCRDLLLGVQGLYTQTLLRGHP